MAALLQKPIGKMSNCVSKIFSPFALSRPARLWVNEFLAKSGNVRMIKRPHIKVVGKSVSNAIQDFQVTTSFMAKKIRSKSQIYFCRKRPEQRARFIK